MAVPDGSNAPVSTQKLRHAMTRHASIRPVEFPVSVESISRSFMSRPNFLFAISWRYLGLVVKARDSVPRMFRFAGTRGKLADPEASNGRPAPPPATFFARLLLS